MRLGESLGREAYQLEFGTARNPKLLFEFKIVVLQHYLHEIGAARPSSGGAWNSLEKGREAFEEFFDANYEKYIDPDKIIQLIATGQLPFGTFGEVIK